MTYCYDLYSSEIVTRTLTWSKEEQNSMLIYKDEKEKEIANVFIQLSAYRYYNKKNFSIFSNSGINVCWPKKWLVQSLKK